MAYDVVIVNNHPVHSNLKQFICTTADDISSLPTSTTRGTQETTDVSINEPVAIGSAAYLADGSAIYNLSADNTWIPQTIVSGGGGASIPYAIVKNDEAEEGSASTYRMVQIDKDGNYVELENSATINIPKDMVVESGEVKECTEDNVPVEGYVVGNKYIDLVLANSDDQHLYINVSDLIDVHNVGKNVEGQTFNVRGTTMTAKAGAEIFNQYNINAATGSCSHAEGISTVASGDYSHAEGSGTYASGNSSHTEGGGTQASGNYSHAEGNGSNAQGDYSHAEGNGSKTTGVASHSEGYATTSYGKSSHSEGMSTNTASSQITVSDTTTVDQIITAWNSKKFSLAKGEASHAEGADNLALGDYSHAEGNWTRAVGDYSHAEGRNSKAEGHSSHAECGGHAKGSNSHASGMEAFAGGENSHAQGFYVSAQSENQHVIGSCNVIDSENKYAFIVGNGKLSFNTSVMDMRPARSNAFAIDWDGKIYINNATEGIDLVDLVNRITALEAAAATTE